MDFNAINSTEAKGARGSARGLRLRAGFADGHAEFARWPRGQLRRMPSLHGVAAVANAKNQLSDLEQQTDAAAKSLAGLQEQSGAAAKNLAALRQQDTEASATLAGLQAKIQTAQGQLDAAISERDKTLAAVANAKNQLSDLEQQTDAGAKSVGSLPEQSGVAANNLAALHQTRHQGFRNARRPAGQVVKGCTNAPSRR